MKLWSESFQNNERISEEFAFGKYNPDFHVELSSNKNPHLAWSDLPDGAKSLVLICLDTDVPSAPDDVNQEGKTVSASLPRIDFFHWVLVDIPADIDHIPAGEHSVGVTRRGKSGPEAPGGMRHGISNYTDWFASDPDMSGDYFGYDGPCPPCNDEIIHHYQFTIYALDIEKCPVEGKFKGPDVMKAIEGHILDKASIIGTYTINPSAT